MFASRSLFVSGSRFVVRSARTSNSASQFFSRAALCSEAITPGAERSVGMVKFFDTAKGYGFIKPKDGSTDVFVHYTEIHIDGFKTLNDEEEVEYTVNADEDRGGKLFATDVTGVNGVPLLGRPRRQNQNHYNDGQQRNNRRTTAMYEEAPY